MPGFFITGTDTGIGKTYVSIALIRHLRRQGLRVLAMKPVASGCTWQDGRLLNDDALLLQQEASERRPYQEVNPFAFELPVSPHLAAASVGMAIDVQTILDVRATLDAASDCLVVEGAGGWQVPLGPQLYLSDLALSIGFPVILVVGMKLGCLNHALLTHEAIGRTGLTCAGWVANRIDADFPLWRENIETLQIALSSPYLGLVDYGANDGGGAANWFSL